MPSASAWMGLLVTVLIGIIMFFVITNTISTVIPPEEPTQTTLPEGYYKGAILQLSELYAYSEYTGTCDIIFFNDLTMYTFYDVAPAQYEVIKSAAEQNQEILIHYETNEQGNNNLKEAGTDLTIPKPEEKPVEFNWWLVGAPLITVAGSYISYKGMRWGYERHIWNKEHRVEIEAKKREDLRIRREKELKKIKQRETKDRTSYQKEGRSSRTAKAAQLLDQLEGRSNRK